MLQQVFGPTHWIRGKGPLPVLGSAPEPDLAVVAGGPDDFTDHPNSALLIVEISDSTLHIDRWKGNLYAASGSQDYWIVDLIHRRLEVRRIPIADSSVKRFGHRYSAVVTYAPDQTLAPLALPQSSIRVADLLP